MRILILSERFHPEISAASVRTSTHARYWIDKGHEVTVVTCAPNAPRGKVFDGYKNKLWQEEEIDGVHVIRIGTYVAPNEGMIRRTLDYLSYMVSSILQCWRFPKYDVMIATSPPIFVPMAGSIIAFLQRKPWVFELRDLWPASITAVGASKSPLLALVEKYELFLYRSAKRVVAVTHSFRKDLASRGIDENKVAVVTNGIEIDSFTRVDDTTAARADLGVDEAAFLVGYIGTTGMAHGLETILEAADLSRDEPHIRYLIMGEGAKRAELEAKAKEMRLDNLIFKNFVPHDEVTQYLSAMDMSIVHLKPDPLFKTVIPSKIFEAMALGLPTIHAVEGESAEIVGRAGSGICVPSGDARAIAENVKRLSKEPETLQTMAAAGVQHVRECYDRRVLADNVLKVLEEVVAEGR